jgi:hypothetical protein
MSDDVMANGHLFQPGRSVATKQVRIDVLHKTATKKKLCFFVEEEVGFK